MGNLTSSSWRGYALATAAFTATVLLLWPQVAPALLATDGFEPHGYCFLWEPTLTRIYVAADSLIGLAYVAISSTLAYLVYRAQGAIPFHWVLLAFGTFILACGGTHFVDIWTLWTPVYWFSGAVKAITAVASVTTALVLPPFVPKALALIEAARISEDRKRKLALANDELKGEIAERKEIEAALRSSEECFRQLIADLPVGVLLQGPQAEILLNNQAALDLLGLSADQLHSKRLLDPGWNAIHEDGPPGRSRRERRASSTSPQPPL